MRRYGLRREPNTIQGVESPGSPPRFSTALLVGTVRVPPTIPTQPRYTALALVHDRCLPAGFTQNGVGRRSHRDFWLPLTRGTIVGLCLRLGAGPHPGRLYRTRRPAEFLGCGTGARLAPIRPQLRNLTLKPTDGRNVAPVCSSGITRASARSARFRTRSAHSRRHLSSTESVAESASVPVAAQFKRSCGPHCGGGGLDGHTSGSPFLRGSSDMAACARSVRRHRTATTLACRIRRGHPSVSSRRFWWGATEQLSRVAGGRGYCRGGLLDRRS